MRSKFQIILIALAFLFVNLSFPVFAQQIVFNKLLPENAPNFGSVGSIAQDENDTMWFATKTGLFSYDGSQISPFRNNPSYPNSLSSNTLVPVWADNNGIIWTGSLGGGLDRLDKQRQRPGISAHIVDKIIQPFFTTKPTGQGTGLGLSLAYDIVKAHGGTITVESHENEGSDFIIQIPIKT